jgi:hypothetical protein
MFKQELAPQLFPMVAKSPPMDQETGMGTSKNVDLARI